MTFKKRCYTATMLAREYKECYAYSKNQVLSSTAIPILPKTLFLFFFFALMGLGMLSHAQSYCQLRGSVVHEDSKVGIEKALILVRQPIDSAVVDSAFTDDAGSYVIDSLELGTTYIVSVGHPDYYYVKPQSIKTQVGKDLIFKLQEVIEGANIRIDGINFSPNSAELYLVTRSNKTLVPDVREGVLVILEFLRTNPQLSVEIACHTDSRGDDLYNLELSQKRALSIRLALIDMGIPAHRMFAKGYGEQQLINKCENDVKCSSEEHALNRRVEVLILPKLP